MMAQQDSVYFRKPDAGKAVWLGAIFPGAGQMYNKSYWKLPIVYGAFMGCGYAIQMNNNRYTNYKEAYLDLYNDIQAGTVTEDASKSYIAVIPEGYDLTRVGGSGKWLSTLKNQQSVYRFNFRFQKGGAGEKTPITTVGVSMTGDGDGLWKGWNMGTGPIPVWLIEPTADPFFVALRFEDQTNAESLHFEVVGSDGVTYLGSKIIPAQYKSNGHFVSAKNTTLTERMQLKKIRFDEGVMQDNAGDSPDGRFDADIAIATGELGALLDDLITALGGEDAEAAQR